jgi:hypothetical protein
MVVSLIIPDVIYQENSDIDEKDLLYENDIFEVILFGKETLITLGRFDSSYKGIIFYRIYLVSDKFNIIGQIGIYEVENYRDIDDDYDNYMEQLSEPLLFSSAEQMIKTKTKIVSENIKEEEILEEKILEEEILEKEIVEDVEIIIPNQLISKATIKIDEILKDGIFLKREQNYHEKLLPDESKDMAESIIKDYNKESSSIKASYNWISKIMKNPNYNIINVDANGDCFFLVIVEAFKQIGRITTVEKLRAIVAKYTTNIAFTENKKLYSDITNEMISLKNEMLRIKSRIEIDLRNKLKSTELSQKKRKELTEEGIKLTEEFKILGDKMKEAKEFKNDTFGFSFNDINSIEDYQNFILTSNYWAETLAISILERELNMKVIILSNFNIIESDRNEILKCGEFTEEMQKNGYFRPDYYILTTYTGNHYKSVTYKNRKILEFSEIPYQIKTMIIQKCMAGIDGPYHIIEDFKNLKIQLGILDDNHDQEKDQNLYDSSSILTFYSKSADMKPGKGSGDMIKIENIMEFIGLLGIKNWRRKLDDSWINIENPFIIDDLSYASVMHYYQGSKYKYGHKDFSILFALESKSEISTNIAYCIAATSKSGKYKSEDGKQIVLRKENIMIDNDFYLRRNIEEREKGIYAKFKDNVEFKNILLNTKKAQLHHFIGNKKPELAKSLMKIRSLLLTV